MAQFRRRRFVHLCYILMIFAALLAFSSSQSDNDISTWRCGLPNIYFASNNSDTANIDWTFTTETCFSSNPVTLSSHVFQVTLTPQFPLQTIDAACRDKIFPPIQLTLTDVQRTSTSFQASSASTGFAFITLPSATQISSSYKYRATIKIGANQCDKGLSKFSILAQFAAADATLSEGSTGPLIQRGFVNASTELLFVFYPDRSAAIDDDHRDIFISLSTAKVPKNLSLTAPIATFLHFLLITDRL